MPCLTVHGPFLLCSASYLLLNECRPAGKDLCVTGLPNVGEFSVCTLTGVLATRGGDEFIVEGG